MKYLKIVLIGIAFITYSCNTNETSTPKRINIDFDWKFQLGDIKNAEALDFDDSKWRNLDVPHDWSIEGEISKGNPSGRDGGFYPTGLGWYRKDIKWNPTWKNKQISITFDGIYLNSDVWINGQHLGKRPNGYIGFTYDLTPHLTKGNNKIAVRVDNSKQPNSRWYTGSGIYRHVWLDVKNNTHIPTSGTYITATLEDSTATMQIQTEISNTENIDKKLTIESKLFTSTNELVNITTNEIEVKGNNSTTSKQSIQVENPLLWSPENPNLYHVETTIKEGEMIVDQHTTTTGIRNMKFDAETGFWLNGKNLKLQGVCMHHEAGSLGAAVPEDVWKRRIELLKEMGCNAIRTSHNPFRPEFYDLCDELGILVLNEAMDGWKTPKRKYDYSVNFDEWWKTDITDFIKRDRNHPSVIMWSIGNEVRGKTDSVETLLVDVIHKLDPTRPVTIGAGHDGRISDIAGFNGQGEFPGALEKIHAEHPDWPIIGTEIPHSWQTRGVYRTKTWWRGKDFPAPWNPVLSDNPPTEGDYHPIPDLTEEEVFTDIDSNYLSSYDNATVRISARDQWKLTNKYDWLMGEFRWTGFDYLGENIWPNRGWHCGVLDLAGFTKDHYYFYQSVWTDKPMVHILPHWTHSGKEGVEIPVVVYSNTDEVELFLNGKSLGVKKDTANDLRLLWYVPYQTGTLKAVARSKGEIVCETEHVTAGKPYALKIISDKTELPADKRSVAHITVKIVDEKGNFVPYANTSFTYEITGPAKLLGIENGDMLDLSNSKAKVKKTFNGLSLIYIQSTSEAGKIELTVKSDGLEDGNVELITLGNN